MTVVRGTLAAGLAVATAFWLAAYAAFPWHGLWRVAAEDVGWSVVCLFAGLSAILAAFEPRNRDHRAAFALLGGGVLSWGTGQAFWTYFELVRHDVPYPGPHDLGFLLAVVLLGAGLVLWPRRSRRTGSVVDALLIVAVALYASFEFVIAPILTSSPSGFGEWYLIAYPLGDLVLVAAFLGGASLELWRDEGRLALVLGAFAAMIVADTWFAILGDSYSTGHVLDAGWTVAFTAVGVAALLPPGWGRRVFIPASLAPTLAIATLAVLCVSVLVDRWQALPRVEWLDSAFLFSLLVLLAFRHAFAGRARLRTAERLEQLQAGIVREATQRQAALDASRTGVCLFGDGGEIVFYNHAWSRLLGPESEHGEGWREFVGSLVLDIAALADAGREREVRFRTAEERHLAISATALENRQVLVSVDDVTDQEQERVVRDRFLARMVGAHDLEARRTAEVLHDDVVQRLTALSLQLELRAARSGDQALGELAGEVGATNAAIRRLLVELHPAVLESQGIAAAVDVAAAGLRERGVDVTVERLDRRLPQPVEQLAYRLVQEAFANVLTHAAASHVRVALSATSDRLHCRVADDGRGFDPDAGSTVARGSLGLQIVRQRIELAGGRFLLESGPGGGTVFGFELPFALEQPDTFAEAAS